MTVATLRTRLTDADVQRLARGESAEDRALAARKICLSIDQAGLSPSDRQAANEVLAYMAQDAADLVRRALAVTLKNSPHLPRDVARRLADDIDSIATPILEHSPSLTDEDLISVIVAGDHAKQAAIAGRKSIPARVVRSLVARADEHAVARVAANDGAEFDEPSYLHALERFGETEEVTDAFIDRGALPVTVTERLVSLVTDQALARLVERHALPPQLAVELAEGARERATIDILDQAADRPDMRRFVQQLVLNGRLTPSLVLRGACMGHMSFFEHALAEFSGVPHEKTWMLVHDAGPLGLRAIFERAGMPQRLFPAVRAAVDVYHEVGPAPGKAERRRFTKQMLERVLTQSRGMSRDELDYLLDKLDAVSSALTDETVRADVAAL